MRARWGVVLGLCLFACGEAYPQRVQLGPQLGIYNVIDGDGSRVMGGLAMRLRLTHAFGIEGSVNYRREEYADGRVRVQSWPVMVTGLLYPLPVLYGAVGVGWYNSSIEYDYSDVTVVDGKQDFGWHFGGGLDLPLGSRTHLVGDIRYVFLDYGFREFPGTAGADANFYVITLGLLFGL